MKPNKKIIVLSTSHQDTNKIMRCLREIQGKLEIIVFCNRSDENKILRRGMDVTFYIHNHNQFNQEYTADLLKIIDDNFLLMPTGFDSIKFLAKNQKFHENTINLPSPELIEFLDNKFTFSEFCRNNDIPHPETTTLSAEQTPSFNFPLLVKHIYGAGNEKIYRVGNLDEFDIIKAQINLQNYIVQQFIEGTDYTFNAYCTHGKITAWSLQEFISIKWRGRSRLNLSKFTNNQTIYEIAEKIIKLTKFHGPINIDFRRESGSGKIYTIETNPRFWYSTHLSLICGVNFLAIANGLEKPCQPKEGNIYGEFIKTTILLLLTFDKNIFQYLLRFTLKQFTIYFHDIIDLNLRKFYFF